MDEIGRIWQNMAEYGGIRQPEAVGGVGTEKEEKKENEEKISHMCESIGHQPLHVNAEQAKCDKTQIDRPNDIAGYRVACT